MRYHNTFKNPLHFEDERCTKWIVEKKTHPFGLDIATLAKKHPFFQVLFVGAHDTETSVEVFLPFIRAWAGCADGEEVSKLRVINVTARGHSDQHYVFFEIWIGNQIFVSGETTDFSGAGNQARHYLESVFAAIAMIYKMEIERVVIDQNDAPKVRALYSWEE